jgi:RNA 2',3'-cyclic 3'-phosphodiesterase
LIRSFFAIALPTAIKERLAGQIRILSPDTSGIKWVDPGQIHLTLKFFGSIATEIVDKIIESTKRVTSEKQRFSLTLKGLGGFPHIRRPRIIWAGLSRDLEALLKLVEELEIAYEQIGIAREDRPFHPHLTLGRNKTNQPNATLFQRLSGWVEEESEPFKVEEVLLYKSDLKPSGPVYSKICSFPLKGE